MCAVGLPPASFRADGAATECSTVEQVNVALHLCSCLALPVWPSARCASSQTPQDCTLAQPCLHSVACASAHGKEAAERPTLRTQNPDTPSRYCGRRTLLPVVYAKLVHRGRKQKNSYLRRS